MAKLNRKEALRQKARLDAEEEFRKQVNRECAYYGMSKRDLAEAIPMPASTLSDLMKEPSMFRLWQLNRIAEVLKLEPKAICSMIGLEVSG